MLKFDYEYPELEKARFGLFICGGDTPGVADDDDEETEDL